MTVGISTVAVANRMLDWLRGTAPATIAGLYLKLHTGDPGAAGTANASAVTTRPPDHDGRRVRRVDVAQLRVRLVHHDRDGDDHARIGVGRVHGRNVSHVDGTHDQPVGREW
ncbi:hypothetical protein SPI1_33 [Skermania phage SPI1]|nr:hypothetical protein SPI1_33 [Skermania phage SPI1]